MRACSFEIIWLNFCDRQGSFAYASKSTWAGHFRLVKYATFCFLSDFLGKKIFKILHYLCACSKVKFVFSCSLAGGPPEFKCFSNREKYYLDFGGLPVTVEWKINCNYLTTYLHFCANTQTFVLQSFAKMWPFHKNL